MSKTITFHEENRVRVFFFDYDFEEDFEAFLSFIADKLGIPLPTMSMSPIGPMSQFEYEGTLLFAGCDLGCFLNIPKDSQLKPETIIRQCYGDAELGN